MHKTSTWSEIKIIESADENVFKYVFTKDDAVAESVLYRYPTFEDRTVVCCSTMSGCPVGCRFCGAGDHFVRSLTTEEIVSQPGYLFESKGIDVSKVRRIQIMFMSMGEPLLNLKALIPAMHELYAKFPNAALLISTSGPRVDYLPLLNAAMEIPTIGQDIIRVLGNNQLVAINPLYGSISSEGWQVKGVVIRRLRNIHKGEREVREYMSGLNWHRTLLRKGRKP